MNNRVKFYMEVLVTITGLLSIAAGGVFRGMFLTSLIACALVASGSRYKH